MIGEIAPLPSCPVPLETSDVIQMAHGGGGRRMANLIEQSFLPALRNDELARLADGAVLDLAGQRIAVSTDSFVVSPAFFPGGDIGSLAVHGTVNDLAMCGAEPLALTVALVLEEGLPLERLERVMRSLAAAAAAIPVPVVTGDTKLVERGKGDGIYINTSGIGRVLDGVEVGPERAQPGDRIIASGPVGDHGIAVMAARHELAFDPPLLSDSGSVVTPVLALLRTVPQTHCLRDPTRGGLATALCELAAASRVEVRIHEDRVPIRPEVRSACELLGYDPLYVACEGRFVAIVPHRSAAVSLATIRAAGCPQAVDIGEVTSASGGLVLLRTRIGSHRRLERLSGEQLPRIC